MEVAEAAIRIFCLCLAALMALAVVHKVKVLAAGDAYRQPLIRLTAWRRRHPSLALGLAANAELAIALLLVLASPAGLGAALALLAVYSWELRRLDAENPCDCFGSFLAMSRVAALRRNLALGVISAAAFVPVAAGVVAPAPVSQATVGGALLVAAVVAPLGMTQLGAMSRARR